MNSHSHVATAHTWPTTTTGTYQAYQVLHFGFTLLPIIAGIDKFTSLLTNWEQYLSPAVAAVIPAHTFMMLVGVVEILAGLLVAFMPRVGAYVVCAWLLGIVINLLMLGSYYDVALRDFGLAIGALALARLSRDYTPTTVAAR